MSSLGLTPEAIIRELTRLGFKEYEASGRGGVTWAHPEHQDGVAVLVPRLEDRQLRGYQETLDSAVQRLAWITEEPLELVRRRLTSPDQIELRIIHSLTVRNTLRLLDAQRVISGFVGLIKNGARTAFNGARTVHHGSGGPEYKEAIDGIEILAPERGSFKLIAISSEEQQLGLTGPPAPTKSRTALATTLSSVGALASTRAAASDLADSDVLSLVDAGVSKQLLNCVDQLAVGGSAGLRLEFRGNFEPVAGVPSAPTEPVVLIDSHVSLVRDLAARLSTYAPVKNYELFGWVETATAARLSLEGFPSGTVIVRQKAGQPALVLVALDSSVFPRVQAGVSEVRMIGTLERVAGRWHLIDPRDVRVSRLKSSGP